MGRAWASLKALQAGVLPTALSSGQEEGTLATVAIPLDWPRQWPTTPFLVPETIHGHTLHSHREF